MTREQIQDVCDDAQRHLMAMEYLEAETLLARAEPAAVALKDFDTLARLYMPLQEARRQRRQRCGEGIVCMDLLSSGPDDQIEPRHVIENYPHGQLLVAGWGSIEPAIQTRQLAAEHELYVETFLGAVYPTEDGPVVAIVPTDDRPLPEPKIRSVSELRRALPPHSLIVEPRELPAGIRKGSAETFSKVMGLWERLHAPFLSAADEEKEPRWKIEKYRRTIRVDYACELAHQRLSDAAHGLCRRAEPARAGA